MMSYLPVLIALHTQSPKLSKILHLLVDVVLLEILANLGQHGVFAESRAEDKLVTGGNRRGDPYPNVGGSCRASADSDVAMSNVS